MHIRIIPIGMVISGYTNTPHFHTHKIHRVAYTCISTWHVSPLHLLFLLGKCVFIAMSRITQQAEKASSTCEGVFCQAPLWGKDWMLQLDWNLSSKTRQMFYLCCMFVCMYFIHVYIYICIYIIYIIYIDKYCMCIYI